MFSKRFENLIRGHDVFVVDPLNAISFYRASSEVFQWNLYTANLYMDFEYLFEAHEHKMQRIQIRYTDKYPVT